VTWFPGRRGRDYRGQFWALYRRTTPATGGVRKPRSQLSCSPAACSTKDGEVPQRFTDPDKRSGNPQVHEWLTSMLLRRLTGVRNDISDNVDFACLVSTPRAAR
jgi:hypothetical protein